MTAYVVVDIEVHDADRYESYKEMAGPTVEQYGGKYIVRGGKAQVLEGERQPQRVVVLEFPDAESAHRWWSSPEYRPARELRNDVATTSMILVEGV